MRPPERVPPNRLFPVGPDSGQIEFRDKDAFGSPCFDYEATVGIERHGMTVLLGSSVVGHSHAHSVFISAALELIDSQRIEATGIGSQTTSAPFNIRMRALSGASRS